MIVRISYACAKRSLPLERRLRRGLWDNRCGGIDESEADAYADDAEFWLPEREIDKDFADSGNDNRRVRMHFAS